MSDRGPECSPTEQEVIEKSRFFRDLRNLTPEEIQKLKEQIAACEGAARIMVHPFFDHYHWGDDNPDVGKDIVPEGLRRMIKANFKSSTVRKSPIIILESERDLGKTMQELMKYFPDPSMPTDKPPIYYVPTEPGSPLPKLGNDPNEDYYRGFNELLYGLGVRKIVLGGMYLMTPEHRQGSSNQSPGCVNEIFKKLSPFFRTELSHFSYKANRRHRAKVD